MDFAFFKQTSMKGKGKMSFKLLKKILKDLFFPTPELKSNQYNWIFYQICMF